MSTFQANVDVVINLFSNKSPMKLLKLNGNQKNLKEGNIEDVEVSNDWIIKIFQRIRGLTLANLTGTCTWSDQYRLLLLLTIAP